MGNLFGQLVVILRTQTGSVVAFQSQIILAVVACTWWVLIPVIPVSQPTMNGLMDRVVFQQIH